MRDRGSMLVFVMLVGVAFTAAVTLALLPVLTALVDHTRAQNAADAAALAGVIGGAGASSAIAAANDATVVAWSRSGHDVTVTVQVGEQQATARATDEP
jgi:ABC-type phosphate transport system substrate-binding protein